MVRRDLAGKKKCGVASTKCFEVKHEPRRREFRGNISRSSLYYCDKAALGEAWARARPFKRHRSTPPHGLMTVFRGGHSYFVKKNMTLLEAETHTSGVPTTMSFPSMLSAPLLTSLPTAGIPPQASPPAELTRLQEVVSASRATNAALEAKLYMLEARVVTLEREKSEMRVEAEKAHDQGLEKAIRMMHPSTMMESAQRVQDVLHRCADDRKRVVLMTVAFSAKTKEQTNMGADLLEFVHTAVANLQAVGERSVMTLTTSASSGIVCPSLPNCVYLPDLNAHPSWKLAPDHYYLLFTQRWILISMVLGFGYTVLSLDTDIVWTRAPLPLIDGIPGIDAAFQMDYKDQQSGRFFVNSGVMLARPSGVVIFRTVRDTLLRRLRTGPPCDQAKFVAFGPSERSCIWPQHVLNELLLMEGWGNGTDVRLAGTVEYLGKRVAALSPGVVGRLCGRRLTGKGSDKHVVLGSTFDSCALDGAQTGLHAQMVGSQTRQQLFALLLNSSTLPTPLAISSSLTPHVCVCISPTRCRKLNPTESYQTGIKRCSRFWPSY